MQVLWTEVRGVVLKAIWDARNAVFHGTVSTVLAARAQAEAQTRRTLRTLLYIKTPTSLSTLRLRRRPLSELQKAFNGHTWGQLRPSLILPRHAVVEEDPAAADPDIVYEGLALV